MRNRTTSRLFERIGLLVPNPTGVRRWPVRPAAEVLRAVESPRRLWLFGPELRPKTVPLRRLG